MAGLRDKQVAGLKGKAVRYEVWDGRGLGVRVTPKGVKSFVLVYHFEGKPRRLTLGRYKPIGAKFAGQDKVTVLTLAQARRAAEEAREKIEAGIDPGVEKAVQRAADKSAETVGELIDDYLRLYARPRKKSAAEDERQLEKDIRPKWGRRKANNIVRRDVQMLLDEVVARGAPIAANRLLAVIRRMFNFGLAREIVIINPCSGIERPSAETRSTRMLTRREIPQFWNGLDRSHASRSICLALRLLLVTAQRRAEVAGLSLEEIDEAAVLWTIPGRRTKNGLDHAVPLSPLAMHLIQAAKIEAARIYDRPIKGTDYLFPTTLKRSNPRPSITPNSLTRVLWRDHKHIGKKISPHDLRRSAHTGMGGEGVGANRFVRDRILNHSDHSPGASYDMFEYLEEKRAALDAWALVLQELVPELKAVTPENVVALRAR